MQGLYLALLYFNFHSPDGCQKTCPLLWL